MAAFIKKDRGEILNQALDTLTKTTPISARSPGSIARALTEAFTTELGDLYDVLDYNISQSLISTATGQGLDNIGALFGVTRNSLTQSSIIDATTGSFYFYVNSAFASDINIPKGTTVYTDLGGFVGAQIKFETAGDVTIVAGRKKVFVPLLPANSLAKSSVGANTLTKHNMTSPSGTLIRCTNPKPISAAPQYETDADFRIRITKQLRVNTTGTAESLRFALLTVRGVRDVVINSASYGLGGAEIVIVPDERGATANFLSEVRARINQVRPVGVRIIVTTPTPLLFSITANLILGLGLLDGEKNAILLKVENDIKIYLNSLMPNEPLVYNRLIQIILDVSEKIKDVQITKYAPNGSQAVRNNYTPDLNEQIIPGNILVTEARST